MNKKLKIWIVMILAMIFAFGFVGCGGSNSEEEIPQGEVLKEVSESDIPEVTMEDLEFEFSDEIYYSDPAAMVKVTNHSEEYYVDQVEVLYRPKTDTTLDDISDAYKVVDIYKEIGMDKMMSTWFEDYPDNWTLVDNVGMHLDIWEEVAPGKTSDKTTIYGSFAGDIPSLEALDLFEPVTYKYHYYKNDGTSEEVYYDVASKTYISDEDALDYDFGLRTWSDAEEK